MPFSRVSCYCTNLKNLFLLVEYARSHWDIKQKWLNWVKKKSDQCQSFVHSTYHDRVCSTWAKKLSVTHAAPRINDYLLLFIWTEVSDPPKSPLSGITFILPTDFLPETEAVYINDLCSFRVICHIMEIYSSWWHYAVSNKSSLSNFGWYFLETCI